MQQMSIGRDPARHALRISAAVFAAAAVYALAVILLVAP
jgi:hypothetical protein